MSSLTKLNLVGKFNPSEFDALDLEYVLKAGLYKTAKAVQKEIHALAEKLSAPSGFEEQRNHPNRTWGSGGRSIATAKRYCFFGP